MVAVGLESRIDDGIYDRDLPPLSMLGFHLTRCGAICLDDLLIVEVLNDEILRLGHFKKDLLAKTMAILGASFHKYLLDRQLVFGYSGKKTHTTLV